MRNSRKRSHSRSSSYDRRRRRSSSYERHHDRPPRGGRDSYYRERERHPRDRSPRRRRSPRRGGVSNPTSEHPDFNKGNNLYITSLHSDVTELELQELFTPCGTIIDVRIVIDPFTKESRGFGFVTFENTGDADEALKSLDGREINGKPIRVEKARRSRPHVSTPGSYCGPLGASSKYRNATSTRRRRTPSPLANSRHSHSRSRSH